MPAPTIPIDIVERSEIAVVAALLANGDIPTITGRPAADSVTSWDAEMTATLPILAYTYTVATPGGGALGDTREIMFLFSAIAATESEANALLDAVERIMWAPTLAAQSPTLDGYMRNPVRRRAPWDEESDSYRSDLELTLTVTK